jgi:hypothetical protein
VSQVITQAAVAVAQMPTQVQAVQAAAEQVQVARLQQELLTLAVAVVDHQTLVEQLVVQVLLL